MSETEPSLPGTLYPTVVTSVMILWLAFETFRPRTRKAYKQEKFVREANKALQKELQTRKFPVISAEWAQAIIAEPYTGHASSDMQLQLVVGLDDSEVMFALSREEAERLGVTTGQVPKSVGFPTASYESCSGKLRLYISEALFEL